VENTNQRLEDRELSIELTEAAKGYVTDHGYDPIYGARPLKRFMQKYVETLAARIILQGEVDLGDKIVLDVEEDHLYARVEKKEV